MLIILFDLVGRLAIYFSVNKHAKFHVDWTIGGAITVKKASKTQYFYSK